MTALTHSSEGKPSTKATDAIGDRFPSTPGIKNDDEVLTMLKAENQRMSELAELVAAYDWEQWKWLEPLLRRRAEEDVEALALLEKVDR